MILVIFQMTTKIFAARKDTEDRYFRVKRGVFWTDLIIRTGAM